jgi:hypothetical protein
MRKLAAILIFTGAILLILLMLLMLFVLLPMNDFNDHFKAPYFFNACLVGSVGIVLLGGCLLAFSFRKFIISEIKSILNS